MDKKTWGMVALLFAAMLFYQMWLGRRYGRPLPPPAAAAEGEAEPGAAGGPEAGLTEEAAQAAQAAPQRPESVLPALEAAEPWADAESGEIHSISNSVLRLGFSAAAGGLREAELFEYRSNGAGPVLLDQWPHPAFALLGMPGVSDRRDWAVTTDGRRLRLTLAPSAEQPLAVVKSFELGDQYRLDGTLVISNSTDQAVVIPDHFLAVGTAHSLHPGAQGKGQSGDTLGFDHFNGRSVIYTAAQKLRKRDLDQPDRIVWAAVKNQYFTVIVTPETPGLAVHARRIDPASGPLGEGISGSIRIAGRSLGPHQATELPFYAYVGPKKWRVLQQLPHSEELVMQFGLFGWLSKGMILTLTFFHRVTHNWGVAIVLLTLLVKGLFWPITHKATLSMKKTQELQPKMAALRAKYKGEQARLQQEMMKLYKEAGVNPLGGCLPLLLQMPVFWALFVTLRNAVELRGASFLWVRDLSAPDTVAVIPGLMLGNPFPINPLAILMGVTMVLQQKTAPMSPGMDPNQQRIMTFMPLIFFFMFYSFPSGLVLYWTLNQVLTIGQQVWTKARVSAG